MIQDGVEMVLVRTLEGPLPGDRVLPITAVGGKWPLPDELDEVPSPLYPPGKYVKVNESRFRYPVDCPNLVRGATYVWKETEGDSACPNT